MSWLIPLLGMGVSLFTASKQSKQLKEQAAEAIRIGNLNADDLIAMTEKNLDLSEKAAAKDAAAVTKIGYANIQATKDAAAISSLNIIVPGMEEDRLLEVKQNQMVGEIRAITGGSGVKVDTGTPLHYMNSQIAAAEHSRKMVKGLRAMTVLSGLWQATKTAEVMKLETDLKAEQIIYNEDINSQIAWNESLARASALRRGADMNASTLRAQASSAMMQGIGSAMQWAGKMYTWNAT